MKRMTSFLAASLVMLSAGGAWALYHGDNDDHGSGSGSDNDHGSVIYYPPSNGTIVYDNSGTYTTGGTTDNTSAPQQTTTGTGTTTPTATPSASATPSVTPSASATPGTTPTTMPSATASPIVFGQLVPCSSTGAGTTGGTTAQPTATPSASAAAGGVAMCINVAILQNASTLGAGAFGVNPLTIPAGTNVTVTWINNDSINHTVTANDGSFDSGSLAPGQSFSHTFSQDGTYPYHCMIHPSMMGTIQIGAAASPTPSATATPGTTPSASPSASPSAMA